MRRWVLTTILILCVLNLVAAQVDPADDTQQDPPVDEGAVPDEPPAGDNPLFDDPLFDDPFGSTDPTADAEATDPLDLDDFDSLFDDEEMISESDPDAMASDPQDDLLQQDELRWGGSIHGSVSADWGWDNVWTPDFGLWEPTDDSLTPEIGATLFFDARPDADFRAYSKLSFDTTTGGDGGIGFAAAGTAGLPAGWTVTENDDGDTEIRDENGTLISTTAAGATEEDDEEPAIGTAPGLEISVFELFADYTWQDALFFRFGKHTIRWGTGYFFSPADVLNLTAVDAEDPTADREGPISLRVHYPFGLTGNAYFYLITNADADLLDVAVAPKVEFAVGTGEVGIGAYYQRTLAPRLLLLYTTSVGDVDFFGEAVALYGSDRVFVRPSRDQSAATADAEDDLDLVLDTFEADSGIFLESTIGARYIKEWEDGPTLVLLGQYFFNGDGYAADHAALLPAAARLALNSDENGLLIENEEDQPDGYEAPPDLGFSDLTNWGRHYVAASVSLSEFMLDDLSLTLFGLLNLSDLSGIVTPAISYRFLDRFSLSLSARFTFGPAHGEYTDPAALYSGDDAEPTFGLTLQLSMPGGSF
jgi:hypothetical protein